MAKNTDVVIIGGGAAGCSVAYYLSLAGVKATVIEREGIGSQASGFSAGLLNPLEGTNIPGPLGPLAIESFRLHGQLWPGLRDSTGIDYEFRGIDSVKVAFQDSDLPEMEESLRLYNVDQEDGFSAHWLERQELLDLEPRISPAAIKGLFVRGNTSLDSYKYTRALAKAAEANGAQHISGTVGGLVTTGGKVTGVLLQGQELGCDQVVLAAGPWSREAEGWLNISLPVDPLKGEILRLEVAGEPIRQDISGGGGSLRPKPDGLVWCGTTEERAGFDKTLSESARQSIMRGVTTLMPQLAGSVLALQTACLRPVTPDWLPIIGRAPGWDNVYLTTGAGKKGILLSPAMGKATADLITQGQTSLSIETCNPQRFALSGRAAADAG